MSAGMHRSYNRPGSAQHCSAGWLLLIYFNSMIMTSLFSSSAGTGLCPDSQCKSSKFSRWSTSSSSSVWRLFSAPTLRSAKPPSRRSSSSQPRVLHRQSSVRRRRSRLVGEWVASASQCGSRCRRGSIGLAPRRRSIARGPVTTQARGAMQCRAVLQAIPAISTRLGLGAMMT
eukprot:CAMPEP_0175694770 /NCGR_PEP_ID=MMETSP0097-20121207/32100_1 /TAXON_ID=311494 /ORGANISM="Alexandrium monilatum, Strain CCMP3105" /LENGTH=172 /DNA_ID=CAMNT_0017001893 /DNA_START=45 /DNA_END=559 /DNA_ORIENTATION=-